MMTNRYEVISIAFLVGALSIAIVGTIAFIYNIKLLHYLKKNKKKRWEQLTSIGIFGPGMSNSFRWFPYLYNNIDNENYTIHFYKKRIRFFLSLAIILLCILLISFIFLSEIVNKT